MKTHLKNYLRTARKRLDLTQGEVAAVLGAPAPDIVSRMERGLQIPTLEESIALRILFNKSFSDLWPYLNYEFEARADNNIRRLLRNFEKDFLRSGRRRHRAKLLYDKLTVIVNGLPDDV